MRRVLAHIRNNAAFHYYNPAELTEGYFAHFARTDSPAYTSAWWSVGKTMGESRFFYADAAAEALVQRAARRPNQEWDKELGELADKVNHALRFLVERFVDERRKTDGRWPRPTGSSRSD